MVTRVITKQLIGIEDLLLGTGSANQVRASGTIPMTKIDSKGLIHSGTETIDTKLGKKAEVVNTVALMKAIGDEKSALVLGYLTPGDGGGGLFWLDTTDTTSVDDGNIVFTPTDANKGRWKRSDTRATISSDLGDADYVIPEYYEGVSLFATTLTVNRTVTLPSANLYEGKTVSVLRSGTEAFSLAIGGVYTIPKSTAALVTLIYTNSTWTLVSYTVIATSFANSLLEVKLYSTAGTFSWTKPDNTKLVEVICVGGGGGGGSVSVANTVTAGAGGGMGGIVAESALVDSAVPLSATIIVGAGGAGGASGAANNGITGGDSKFDLTVVAKGGTGGPGEVSGASTVTSAQYNSMYNNSIGNEIKIFPIPQVATEFLARTFGSPGGASFGGGGPSTSAFSLNVTAGIDGIGAGAGGGGAMSNNSNGAKTAAGGAGKDGKVIIKSYA